MHIFFSVGEPSGDQHAAQLIRAYRRRLPGTRCSGLGGPEMQAAGLECLFQLTDLAVMGLTAILPLLRQFYRVYREAKAFIERERPDAVVLVDFPGFNWWIAAAAKRAGIPVYYYCPPQLWAWAPWRIRKVRKYVDCVLSVLPFEYEWYRERGIDVEYVGHPFFDDVAQHALQTALCDEIRARAPQNVALLPGSRKQEVVLNFPVMLEMVEKLHAAHPHVRFPVACYKQWHFDRCREFLQGRDLPVDLYLSSTSEVIEAVDCCLMVSGSVSLEVLARRKPAVVLYAATWLSYCVGRMVITCRYMSLPNLIAGREVMPELAFLNPKCRELDRLRQTLDNWLNHHSTLQQAQQEMAELAASVVEFGGVERAAEVLFHRTTAHCRLLSTPHEETCEPEDQRQAG